MVNLLDFLYPQRCVGCGALGSYICGNCRQQVRFNNDLCPECDQQAIDGRTHISCQKTWGIDGLNTIFGNRRVIKKAIKTLKYRFVTDIGESLIALIPQSQLNRIKLNNPKSWLYPIPLHRDRLKWRGFNQAEKLCKIFADKLDLPLIDGLLIRQTKRLPQADIKSRQQRIDNAKGLFKIHDTKLPDEIILFDDVWTTGATMKEATKVLKRAGVKKVWAVALAR